MINICLDCHAVREYPSGKKITVCPRCDSTNIKYKEPPTTKEGREEFVLQAITGDYPKGFFE